MQHPGVLGFDGRAQSSARPFFLHMRKLLLLPLLLTTVSCVYWTPLSRRTSSAATVIPDVPLQKWDIISCGAGSLSSVLQHYGDPVTMAEWQETLPKTRGGVMSIDLVLAARQRGFDARLITGDRVTIEREVREGRPVILMLQVVQYPGTSLDFFHYVVLDGIDDKRGLLRTQFGDGKARWVKYKRLEVAWKTTGRAAILIRPKDPMSDVLRTAVQLEEKGKDAEAADVYRGLLARHPESVVGWTNLGNVEMRLGEHASAERSFRRALELDATARDAMNNLAWLLYETKRFDEAETLARKASTIPGPDSYMVLDTLARILMAKGACDEAVTRFQEAIAAVPQSRESAKGDLAKGMIEARTSCRS